MYWETETLKPDVIKLYYISPGWPGWLSDGLTLCGSGRSEGLDWPDAVVEMVGRLAGLLDQGGAGPRHSGLEIGNVRTDLSSPLLESDNTSAALIKLSDAL